MHKHSTYFHSPLGIIKIEATSEKITSIRFLDSIPGHHIQETKLLNESIRQLLEYFNKARQNFFLPYETEGTEFQKQVWDRVAEIKYAGRATYKDIARAANSPNACRAVGNAVSANPLPIIIPCHRIIGSHGRLGGFSSGLWRKEWLLEHEQNNMNQHLSCSDTASYKK